MKPFCPAPDNEPFDALERRPCSPTVSYPPIGPAAPANNAGSI